MKRKVLLIFPSTGIPLAGTSERISINKGIPIIPPLGPLYLASELLSAGYEVEVVDFNAIKYSSDTLFNKLIGKDVVGISVLSFNRDQAKSLISEIKTINPSLPVIVGGPDITLHPRLFEGSDVSVIGEAEDRIVEIVQTVLNKGDLSQCSGVIFRDKASGKIKEGKKYEVQTNLDTIKFPARHLVFGRYGLLRGDLGRKVATIITSRGCPFNCRFCAHNAAVFQNYRERSVDNVLDEIQQIYDNGYEILGIVDDNFTANPRRAFKIMDGIVKRGIKLKIGLEGRVDAANYELYSVMKEAGVRFIVFGIESGNQDVLDYYHKKTTVEQNQYAIELTEKLGILSGGEFIIGAPIETEEHFNKTISFAKSVPLDFATFWVLEYSYGSQLWDEAYTRGLIKGDEFNVPAGSERGLSSFTTKELETICVRAFRSFYLRPTWSVKLIQKLVKMGDPYILKVVANIVHTLILQGMNKLFKRRSYV